MTHLIQYTISLCKEYNIREGVKSFRSGEGVGWWDLKPQWIHTPSAQIWPLRSNSHLFGWQLLKVPRVLHGGISSGAAGILVPSDILPLRHPSFWLVWHQGVLKKTMHHTAL